MLGEITARSVARHACRSKHINVKATLTAKPRSNGIYGKVLALGPPTKHNIEKFQRTLRPQRGWTRRLGPKARVSAEGVSSKQHT